MILAHKILALRKQYGWSQEELAEKLQVSRQSVSKWESAASLPDMTKILELANTFEVTTDYLLKDSLGEPEYTQSESEAHKVTLQEANAFLLQQATFGKRLGLAVVLFILSPACLMFFGAWAETGYSSEAVALSIGLTALLVFAALGVFICIFSSTAMQRYAYLDKGSFVLDFGVASVVREHKNAHQSSYTKSIAGGVCLCILGALPVALAGPLGASELTASLSIVILLLIEACGVYWLVAASTLRGGFDRLLQEGEFSPAYIRKNKLTSKFAGFYWPVVVAIFLGWSFYTHDWGITWVVFPVAGLLFAGIASLLERNE